jgi:hypothetical protein
MKSAFWNLKIITLTHYLSEVMGRVDPDPIDVGWWVKRVVHLLAVVLVHKDGNVLLQIKKV